MPATIEVNKKSVKDLLSEGKEHKFLIPAYQRPYEWDEERIRTLFDDLWDFTVQPSGKTYFLGCIVTFENECEQYEVIDGQQRITSLFLLLRAVFAKLESMEPCDPVNNLKSKIEPAIWFKDDITGEVHRDKIFIESKVIDSKDNDVFEDILKNGDPPKKAKDLYSKNYRLFSDLLDEHSKDNPMLFYQFVNNILQNCVIFPINADSQDTALSIFTTLNDRGMQLNDADIFKSKIYQMLPEEQKDPFIDRWNELFVSSNRCGKTLQQMFTYYMSYLRAQKGDKDTSTPALRKFFTENKSERLRTPSLLDDVEGIVGLWNVIMNHDSIEGENWSTNIRILKGLDILNSYPHEMWVQPIVCYYLSHKDSADFELLFEAFVYKLISELVVKYLNDPRIPQVRFGILTLNIDAITNEHPTFSFEKINRKDLGQKMLIPHKMIARMLMKLIAYNSQDEILPPKWEIEHILPQHWQDHYFVDLSEEEIREKIEHIGNKIPFEKKLNIVASDGYFAAKRKHYSKSGILIVKELSKTPSNDWHINNIEGRDAVLINEICDSLELWREQYDSMPVVDGQDGPSEDQQRLIDDFRKKGWIE